MSTTTPGARQQARYRERRRVRATAHLGGKCAGCAATEGLEFDHVDPRTKVADITAAIVAAWAWDRLAEELAKCQLLCGPCHREKTRAGRENTGGGWNRIEDPEHGTVARYDRLRCRCPICQGWKRRYRRGEVDARGHAVESPQGANVHGTHVATSSSLVDGSTPP